MRQLVIGMISIDRALRLRRRRKLGPVAVVVELAADRDHRAVEGLADDAVRRDRADGRLAILPRQLRLLVEGVELGVEEPVQPITPAARRQPVAVALVDDRLDQAAAMDGATEQTILGAVLPRWREPPKQRNEERRRRDIRFARRAKESALEQAASSLASELQEMEEAGGQQSRDPLWAG